jgi:maltooligosyltrehalose trehalohydrolase
VRLDGHDLELAPAGDGVYEGVAPAQPGDDYWFVLDGQPFPDPCSLWQPAGLRGPSRVFSPGGAPRLEAIPAREELVVYELHVGTFTSEGTFEAAATHMAELASLGVTAIEVMPVAEFPGHHGWGYDGVYLSAAHSAYGGPSGLLHLIATAHALGLAVILDVVYNHVGASGVTALEAFAPYFTDKYETPWGKAINYDDEGSAGVREWVCQSAEGWVRDFAIDGLRLDAIHAIFDSSSEPIVAELARRVHAVREDAVMIAESDLPDPDAHGGAACDAVWRDDFHHALHVLLTGEHGGYYKPFGRVEQLANAMARTPGNRYVVFDQNHDQVGNRAFGDRLSREVAPLAAFCVLLSPFLPMLFMGEEYGEPAPFQFFSDHIDDKIARATREGRRQEFAAFAEFAGEEIPDPQEPATFERSKLTRERDPELEQLYRRMIELRRRLPPDAAQAVAFDEDARWLRWRRGGFEFVCNFSSALVRVDCKGSAVELATSGAVVSEGRVELPPTSGVAIR